MPFWSPNSSRLLKAVAWADRDTGQSWVERSLWSPFSHESWDWWLDSRNPTWQVKWIHFRDCKNDRRWFGVVIIHRMASDLDQQAHREDESDGHHIWNPLNGRVHQKMVRTCKEHECLSLVNGMRTEGQKIAPSNDQLDDLQILPSREITMTETSSWYLRRSPCGISSNSWKSIPVKQTWNYNHVNHYAVRNSIFDMHGRLTRNHRHGNTDFYPRKKCKAD